MKSRHAEHVRLVRAAALAGAIGLAGAVVAQPANDDCANATPISFGQVVAGTTIGATAGSDITSCTIGDTIDVWYELSIDTTDWTEVSLCGAGGDTSLAVFDTCGGTELACDDDGCSNGRARLDFFGEAGQTYLVRVSHAMNATGVFRLTSAVGSEPANGPDVQYTDCVDVTNWGAVSGVRGYSLASYTCNVGDEGLLWGFGADETPVLAMNAYRYLNGEFRQIGQSWCKTACCAAQGDGCGLGCSTVSGMLGPGCRDIYGSSYNGGQSRLAPRSTFNAWTGSVTPAPGGGGNAIYKRLQVAESDMGNPAAIYWVEGVYIGSDDAASGNHFNNASYKRVSVTPGSFNMTPTGSMQIGMPAVYGWQDIDPMVQIVNVDVPGEGRFVVAGRASPIAGDRYRYQYAVFNINSDRCGASLSVPVGANTTVDNIGFHDVDYHSGEVYDNTDWIGGKDGADVRWETTTPYVDNQNGNALRWGITYSFWFETDAPPTQVDATLGLFKPGTPDSVGFTIVGPEAPASCPADWNDDGFLNDTDFFDWLNDYFSQSGPQGQFDFNLDGFENAQDWFDFTNAFFSPGPACAS